MDPALPSFILGYHGCDASVAERGLARTAPLSASDNDDDWLGDGIYFWEHNAQRAYEFAVQLAQRPHPSDQQINEPAVVGAVIGLGYCLNLLGSRFLEAVGQAYAHLETAVPMKWSDSDMMPQYKGAPDRVARYLDCAVIRTLHEK